MFGISRKKQDRTRFFLPLGGAKTDHSSAFGGEIKGNPRSSRPDPLERIPDAPQLLRLFLFLGIAVAPHLLYIDKAFSGVFFLLLIYRTIALYLPRLLPSRPLLHIVTLGVFTLFLFRTQSLVGAEAGVSLLLLMSSLKLLELHRRSDLHFSILLGFFLLITVFLFDSSIPVALPLFFAAVGLISLLIDSTRINQKAGWAYGFKQALALSLQALPISLILFFLFPRFSGPLWSLNLGEKIARTGLSDSITPGSISQLILSREPAFRVEFHDKLPPPQQRYWRGPVLWLTDGLHWTRSQPMMEGTQEVIDPISSLHYTLYLEPSNNPWLILLDLPGVAPPESMITRDFQVVTKSPTTRLLRYEAVSYPSFAPLALDTQQQRLGLQVPNTVSPRVRALAESWRNTAASSGEILNKALRHFNQQPFVYSLRPPLLGNDPVDEFLFETRRGFCEHFATSFTLLMRLAGIPSRLVTGYQGGEVNPQGNYVLVRQSDAHAWSEVWLPGQGWTRVDPTAAVAPERIERSLDMDAEIAEGDAAVFMLNDPGVLGLVARNFRWGLDALNLSWQRWVIGYDRDRQLGFLSRFRMEWLDTSLLGFFTMGLSAIGFIVIFSFIYPGGDRRSDPVLDAYSILCKRIAAIGIERRLNEGPIDFQRRIILHRPDLTISIAPVFLAYVNLRFGRASGLQRKKYIRLIREYQPQ